MLFLIAVILAVCIAIFLKTPLKKCPIAFYLAAAIISAAVAFLDFRSAPDFVNNYIIALFSRGALATGLWAVVMWAGALPNGSKLMKTLMPIRGELSIFAAILTLGHNIGFGKTYFVRMFTAFHSMSAQQLAAGIISIIMLMIMLPLTVLSFPKIRKKFKAKTWKNIQRSAYAFYALIYIHVMILSIPFAFAGRSGYLLNVAVYSVVFISYAAFRIRKQIVLKQKPKAKSMLNFCSAAASVILCAVIISFSFPKSSIPSSKDIETESENTSVSEPQTSFAESSAQQTEPADNSAVQTISDEKTEPQSIHSENTSEMISESVSESDEENVTEIPSAPQQPTYQQTENNAPEVIEKPLETAPQISETERVTEAETIPEPEYIYNNGVYTASAYGYDGDIFVTITIENDKIISITAYSEESDLWYFDSAADTVIERIIAAQDTDVDAVSGATFSSKGIMSAVAKALESAKRQ